MLQRNKNQKLIYSAKIYYKGKEKSFFRRGQLEKFEEEIELLPDIEKQADGKAVLNCIMSGRKVVLDDKGKIYLFSNANLQGKIEPSWTITKNKELYSLVKKLFLS